MRGHVSCAAPTGSGKTLAPAACRHARACRTAAAPGGGGTLVLVPTRELAMQVLGLCRSLYRRAACELRITAASRARSRWRRWRAAVSTCSSAPPASRRHAPHAPCCAAPRDDAGTRRGGPAALAGLQPAGDADPQPDAPRPPTLLFSARCPSGWRLRGTWLKQPMRIYAEADGAAAGRVADDHGASGVARRTTTRTRSTRATTRWWRRGGRRCAYRGRRALADDDHAALCAVRGGRRAGDCADCAASDLGHGVSGDVRRWRTRPAGIGQSWRGRRKGTAGASASRNPPRDGSSTRSRASRSSCCA